MNPQTDPLTPQYVVDAVYRHFVTEGHQPGLAPGWGCALWNTAGSCCPIGIFFPYQRAFTLTVAHWRERFAGLPTGLVVSLRLAHDEVANKVRQGQCLRLAEDELSQFQVIFQTELQGICKEYALAYPGDERLPVT